MDDFEAHARSAIDAARAEGKSLVYVDLTGNEPRVRGYVEFPPAAGSQPPSIHSQVPQVEV